MGELCVGSLRNEFMTFFPRNGRLDRENDKFLLRGEISPHQRRTILRKVFIRHGFTIDGYLSLKPHLEGELFPLKNE